MRLRLRCGFPAWLETGECLTDCDSKARKSLNVSQIAIPFVSERRQTVNDTTTIMSCKGAEMCPRGVSLRAL